MKNIFFFLLVLYSFTTFSQGSTDSLFNVLRIAKHDTTRVKTLAELARQHAFANPDTAEVLAMRALQIAASAIGTTTEKLPAHIEKIIPSAGTGSEEQFYILTAQYTYGHLGMIHAVRGNFTAAMDNMLTSLGLCEEILRALPGAKEEKLGTTLLRRKEAALGGVGNIYSMQAQYPQALEYYLKGLALAEKLESERAQAAYMSNIGIIYDEQKEFQKALDYYNRALTIYERLKDEDGISTAYSNIGVVYDDMKDTDKALGFFMKALALEEKLGYTAYSTNTIGNIGNVYKSRKEYDRALEYYLRGLEIDNRVGNRNNAAHHMVNIGSVYIGKKEYGKAEEYLSEALAIAKEIRSFDIMKSSEQGLSELYAETGKWDKAYTHYKNASALKDSIFNEEKSMDIGRLEGRFEVEKKLALAQVEHEKQIEVEQEKQQRQRLVIYAAVIGLVMVAVFSFVVMNRLKVTRMQKKIIEQQKARVDEQNRNLEEAKGIIEEKNKDILDSINYARRLQEAILPSPAFVQQHLRDSFILYRPKDIVAGDFYWMETSGDLILLAAADCTGHGVPGAMVSVVCSNALNRTVKEFGITEPGAILDKVRQLVIETFEKSSSDVKDGMDISLCSISMRTRELKYAGANNPLWIVSEAGELKELAPDKQPVGKHANSKPFTTHTFSPASGDMIYLFSDGYADQFGGPSGKKFKYRQLKELLLLNRHRPVNEQQSILACTLDDWKKNIEQVDDILVMGVRMA